MNSGGGAESFQRALEEARGNQLDADVEDGGQRARSPNVLAQLAFPSANEAAGKACWEEAMAWATDTAQPPVAGSPSPGLRPEASADSPDELGLTPDLTDAELRRLWREFVWRNHPDRQPPGARRGADARVAAANALYDQARRKMRGG